MSQTFNEVLATLDKGDVVKLSATLCVKSHELGDLICEEVQSGTLWCITPEESASSAKLEVVKKAVPQRQSFRVGNVILGKTIKDVQWRRGTVVASCKTGSGWVLERGGRWLFLDALDWTPIDFSAFDDDTEYVIQHLPK